MTEHIVEFYDLNLEVHGTYYRGKLGTYQDPPEYQGFEIGKIMCNGLDLTDLLDNSFNFKTRPSTMQFSKLDEIEEIILEKYYGE
jgi:hypothetical protein